MEIKTMRNELHDMFIQMYVDNLQGLSDILKSGWKGVDELSDEEVTEQYNEFIAGADAEFIAIMEEE
jgi:hypothetical protein